MNPYVELDVPNVDEQTRAVQVALETVGVAVALTTFANGTIVAFLWHPRRARQCRPIADAFATAFATGEPLRRTDTDFEAIDFPVQGEETRASQCGAAFMRAVLEKEGLAA